MSMPVRKFWGHLKEKDYGIALRLSLFMNPKLIEVIEQTFHLGR